MLNQWETLYVYTCVFTLLTVFDCIAHGLMGTVFVTMILFTLAFALLLFCIHSYVFDMSQI